MLARPPFAKRDYSRVTPPINRLSRRLRLDRRCGGVMLAVLQRRGVHV